MPSLHSFLALAGLVAFAIVIYDFTTQYVKATSTGWQRVWDAGRGSATMVVSQLGVAAAGLTMATNKVTDFVCGLFNTPETADQIKSVVSQYVTAQNLGIAMLVFAVVVAWARSRSLKKA